jgi:Ca2+-binding RTX toxin-like protein
VVLDYETKNQYSIRVRSTDRDGFSIEKELLIDVVDMLDATASEDRVYIRPIGNNIEVTMYDALGNRRFKKLYEEYRHLFLGGLEANDIVNMLGTPSVDNFTINSDFVSGKYFVWTGSLPSRRIAGGEGDDKYFLGTQDFYGRTTEVKSLQITDSGGRDMLSFSGSWKGVQFDLASRAVQHANEVLSVRIQGRFEIVEGSDYNDTLVGDRFDNEIIGRMGDDIIIGLAGNDLLIGGHGHDTFVFHEATASEIDTVLESRLSFEPSSGNDTLDFSAYRTSVRVDLGSTSQQSVANNRVLLIGPSTVLENVIGGQGDDVLIGSAVANILVGNKGNDQIDGLGGNDLLIGGRGADTINGGDGEDIVIGGWTVHDSKLANLKLLHNLWLTPNTYEQRVASIRSRSGRRGPEFNANIQVFDDGARSDVLMGNADRDWFFASSIDQTLDKQIDEFVDQIANR